MLLCVYDNDILFGIFFMFVLMWIIFFWDKWLNEICGGRILVYNIIIIVICEIYKNYVWENYI